ncbi:MAG TPA: EcsC family protein [Marmoricola sp.]|nr:EcsC family protein [Marmoricola sp.]
MSRSGSMGRRLGTKLAPKVTAIAPTMTSTAVLKALDGAINGVSRLSGAAAAADAALEKHHGNTERAIHHLIEKHVRYAGAQGMLTNIGGLTTLAVAIPANLAGLALVECRLIAAIIHLRGYDLADPRTRNGVLACLLGPDALAAELRKKRIPGDPNELLTAKTVDPDLTARLANAVATELITRATGTRVATTVGRRVPILGGAVGAGSDGYATWKLGRFVDREIYPA